MNIVSLILVLAWTGCAGEFAPVPGFNPAGAFLDGYMTSRNSFYNGANPDCCQCGYWSGGTQGHGPKVYLQ